MTTGMEDYSFTRFANLDFYRRINSRLLDLAEIGDQKRIVDLGCGTGGVTRLIVERLHAARQSVIFGIDHSAAAIRQAIVDLGDRRNAMVKFIQADATTLAEAIKGKVDAVVYCNSIHYVPDKASLIAQIKRSLRRGGTLSFNTSFFEGENLPESEEFYRRWMFRSLRLLRREHGLKPARLGKVESRRHLTADEYETLVEEGGLKILKRDVMKVKVPLQGWIDISGYRDFIEGAMPGVPLAEASASLQRGAREIYEEHRLKFVMRNWLGIVAARP